MADLDDELLALAGDSEEEASPQSQSKSKSASPPPPSSSAKQPSPDPAPGMARKGTAKVVKRPRKAKKDESEEGEL